MNVTPTSLPGVVVIEPKVYSDARGHFLETWNQARYAEAGLPSTFIQDNLSFSSPGVLRGLHYQFPGGQAKLVSVLSGAVFDVAVDIRRGSPTFGRWVGETLSSENHKQMFIPAGFAHGFVVLGDVGALFSYKVDSPYSPRAEGTILWNDPALAITWPLASPILSAKDREGFRLADMPENRLPESLPIGG
jgi:dTDP-4-dehydrorhamnose 3,5-epimerase